jgi:hypothetical protein
MLVKPLFVLSVIASLLVGCASSVPVKPSVEVPKLDLTGKVFVVAPAVTLHPELREMTEDIQREAVRQLQAKGLESSLTESAVFERNHQLALTESGSIYDPALGEFLPLNQKLYARQLMQGLSVDGEFDYLMMPELVLRSARVEGGLAYWDSGVERVAAEGGPLPVSIKGLSVKMTLYRRDGSRVFQSFGAVTLPFKIEYKRQQAQYVLRQEALQSLLHTQQGVAFAIDAIVSDPAR